MVLVEFMPWLAGAVAVSFVVSVAMKQQGNATQKSWLLPATLTMVFLAWSISAIVTEGPIGFWREHTRNLWGNQIWFDLLIAVCIGWYLIVPQAKALGMKVLPWSLLIICTGCIGFLAMLSRYLFLKERAAIPQVR
jgi:TRAP-type uncharacterized transport system fused permease subunit